MKAYYIRYKMHQFDEEHGVDLLAANKADAYDKAIYEIIPQKEGSVPYSAWVCSVTYNNGNCKHFNTHEGKPY